MLNPDSQWRIALARQIAAYYEADAIMLVGSSVDGLADAYSDVDILMFWDAIPDETLRRARIEAFNGRIVALRDNSPDASDLALQSQDDIFHLGDHDLKIDITHKTIASQQKLIDDVVLCYDMHPYKMGAVYGISLGLALSGENLIQQWQAQIGTLPQGLFEKLLPTYLHTGAHQLMKCLLIERDDVLLANRLLNEFCEKVVYALLILNRTYPPLTLKHLRWMVDSLEVKPLNLIERITAICSLSPAAALPLAVQLVEDTFDIIAAQGYDVSNARAHFNIQCKANYQPITINEEINTNG